MPLYGQAFTLANSKSNELNAPAPGPGQAGEFTRQAGFLAYYEVKFTHKFSKLLYNFEISNRFVIVLKQEDGL